MKSMPATKYRPFPKVDLPDRRWPEQRIERAPRWCSVDLRDGNQALVEPMDPARKLKLWELLLDIGFDEIEVSFPSSSEPEYVFIRRLIEEHRIPEGVTIQVLTQARDDLMERTFEALRGARSAIVHLYNSTSELQRRVVFRTDRAGCIDIARRGAERVRELALRIPDTDVRFEYSPESFTETELDFAVEISEAVLDIWEPTPERPVILNVPATVERATPNIHADQVEWFARHLSRRDCVVLSVHPHNDRGTAVAAAELSLMAGADRVEGTLFGNGERTGNVDLLTLALNLYTQGVDPGLAFWNVDAIARVAEECTRLPVHPRHPYAGELVYTSFSGSHQDAIRKGLDALHQARSDHWTVPYLPIDPADVGRSYDPVIRINSQSGKGGVAFVLEHHHGLRLPRALQVEFAKVVQRRSEETAGEVEPEAIWQLFREEYLSGPKPIELRAYATLDDAAGMCPLRFELSVAGRAHAIEGSGSGPLDALVDALALGCGIAIEILDYEEHALGEGARAEAAAYVRLRDMHGRVAHGVAVERDSLAASLRAVVCAVNRLERAAQQEPE
jgi:2-isopropylmalate synthase